MAGDRRRLVDYWITKNYGSFNATEDAADEIIERPEKHLLTQD